MMKIRLRRTRNMGSEKDDLDFRKDGSGSIKVMKSYLNKRNRRYFSAG